MKIIDERERSDTSSAVMRWSIANIIKTLKDANN